MNKKLEKALDDLLEICADLEHERWSKWYRYQRDNTTDENTRRWNMQEKTPYSKLSEEDKEKDRKQVYPYFKEIISFIDTNFIAKETTIISKTVRGRDSIRWNYNDK